MNHIYTADFFILFIFNFEDALLFLGYLASA